ncbi:hypothetical protein BH20CHL2_BH20CHL2_02690 [soil metagenome]
MAIGLTHLKKAMRTRRRKPHAMETWTEVSG